MEGIYLNLDTYMKGVSCPKDATAKARILYCLWQEEKMFKHINHFKQAKGREVISFRIYNAQ